MLLCLSTTTSGTIRTMSEGSTGSRAKGQGNGQQRSCQITPCGSAQLLGNLPTCEAMLTVVSTLDARQSTQTDRTFHSKPWKHRFNGAKCQCLDLDSFGRNCNSLVSARRSRCLLDAIGDCPYRCFPNRCYLGGGPLVRMRPCTLLLTVAVTCLVSTQPVVSQAGRLTGVF